MNKKVKLCLALLLALAVLAQYSFSPQAMVAYGLDNTDNAVQTEEAGNDGQQADKQDAEESTKAEEDVDKSEDTEESANTEKPTEATEATDADKDAKAEEPADENKEDVKYPAKSFSETVDGVKVDISAPEGALPEGTTVKVEPVKASEIQDAVDELIDDSKIVKAVDITFYNKEGKEIEPKEKVSVAFASKEFKNLNDAQVVHINDKGEAEKVKGSDVDGNKATFKSDEFSIYAVIDSGETGDNARATVYFKEGDNLIATMYVKNSDTVEALETILYDPGVGRQLASREIFKGWHIVTDDEPDYSASTTPKTIEGVREYFAGLINKVDDEGHVTEAGTIKEGDEITIQAMIFKAYTITYQDENGTTIESATALAKGDSPADFTVNMSYIPQDPDQQFQGWFISPISNATLADGDDPDIDPEKAYPNGTKLKVTGPLTLKAKAPNGKWLIFVENGSGASYTSPQFREATQETEKPDDPTRYGYMFTGWNTKSDGSGETWLTVTYDDQGNPTYSDDKFGGTISDNTTLYARWAVKSPADYSVIIWLENLAGNGYDFATSVNLKAAPTTTASNAVTIHGEAGDAASYVSINGHNYNGSTEDAFKGFHYLKTEANNDDEVVPAGTTVVNVYYARTEYTLKFYYARSRVESNYSYTKVAHTNRNGTPTWEAGYGYVAGTTYYRQRNNGSYVEVDYDTRTQRFDQNNSDIFIREEIPTLNYQVSSNYNEHYTENGRWNGSGTTEPGCTFGTKGTEERGNYTYYYSTLKAKYGTDIGEKWPTYDQFETYDSYRLGSWAVMDTAGAYVNPTKATIKGKITIMDEQILGNLTSADGNYLYANYDTASSQHDWVYHIFFQNEEGSGYYKKEDVQARSHDNGTGDNWQTQQKPPAYSGMTFERMTKLAGLEINMYYTRDSKTIAFMDGVYVKGDGGSAVEEKSSAGTLHEVNNIPFNADVSSYNKGESNYYIPTKDNIDDPEESSFNPTGFVFDGWYVDSKCQTPYTFDKMPVGGITVYAKWVQKQYRVFLHTNVPTSVEEFGEIIGYTESHNPITKGLGSQQTSFRMDYGDSINTIGANWDNHVLVGWYYDENLANVYGFDAYVMNEANPGVGEYDKSRSTETDAYGEATSEVNKDEKRFWITESLDLYAKWRNVLSGTDGINVVYDAGAGTNPPEDGFLYQDNTNAVAFPASTAPQGKQFLYWVVQSWDKGKNKYVDTNTIVYPGDTFSVLAENAKIEEDPDDPEKYTYTVQLRAEYGDKTQKKPTHVYWYGNGGTAASGYVPGYQAIVESPTGVAINEAFDILSADTFTREGYTFAGWAKITEPASLDGFIENDSLDTWLKYEGGKFKIDSTEVTQLAADEVLPYEAMVATWKKDLTITVNDATKRYTGNEQKGYVEDGNITATGTGSAIEEEEYTITGLVAGDKLTVTGYSPSSGTTAGTYDNGSFNRATIKIMRGEGQNAKDVTKSYKITTTAGKLTINNKIKLTITAKPQTYTYNGEAQGPVGTYTEGFNDYVTVEGLEEGDELTSITMSGSKTNAGTYPNEITPSAAQIGSNTDKYDIEYKTAKLTIEQRVVTVSVSDISKEYNGSEQSGNTDCSFTNVVSGQTATITYTPAKGTLPNTYDNGSYGNDFKVVSGTTDVTANYTLGTKTKGKLTITDRSTKYDITVVANSNTGNVYDGTVKEAKGFETLTFIVEGNTYTVEGLTTSNPSSTDVCNVKNEISGTAVVKDANGNDVTDQFDVSKTDGTLEITKRTVTVKVEDLTLEYNGSEQSGNTDCPFTNLVSGQTATITYTPAKGTLPNTYDNGSYGNDFKVVSGTTDVTGNYTLGTKTKGKLTITDRSTKYDITVVANSNTGNVYDGAVKKAEGFETLTFLVDGNKYTVEGLTTSDPSSTDVCNLKNEISGTAAVKDAKGNDVTNQFFVSTKDGMLEIKAKQITVTISGHTGSWKYDGNEYAVEGYDVTISDSLYKEDYIEFTGEPSDASAYRINAGTTTMSLDGKFSNTNKNFDVTFNVSNGGVTITKRNITIVSANAEKVYDGAELTNHDYTISGDGFVSKDEPSIIVTGSQTAVGESDNTFTVIFKDSSVAMAMSGVYKAFAIADNYKITKVYGKLKVTEAPTPTPTPTPTPGGGGRPTPGGGGTPAAAGPAAPAAPAAPATTITDNPAPTTIIDDPAPKAITDYWALLNLLSAIATALLSIFMLIRYFTRRREEDEETGEEYEVQRKGKLRIASIIPAIGAIIAFILTEDMSLPMALTDKWTVLMLAILALQVLVAIFANVFKNEEDEEEEDEATA